MTKSPEQGVVGTRDQLIKQMRLYQARCARVIYSVNPSKTEDRIQHITDVARFNMRSLLSEVAAQEDAAQLTAGDIFTQYPIEPLMGAVGELLYRRGQILTSIRRGMWSPVQFIGAVDESHSYAVAQELGVETKNHISTPLVHDYLTSKLGEFGLANIDFGFRLRDDEDGHGSSSFLTLKMPVFSDDPTAIPPYKEGVSFHETDFDYVPMFLPLAKPVPVV